MIKKKVTTAETTKGKTARCKKTAAPALKSKAGKPASASKKAATAQSRKTTSTSRSTKAATKDAKPGKEAKAQNQQEKRQYLRLHYSRLISFVCYDADNHTERPAGMAAIKNLSEAGILIETGTGFEPGDKLDLDIAFEQDKIIPARGEIVHTKKGRKSISNVGIRFTKINKKDLKYLRRFLEGIQDRT